MKKLPPKYKLMIQIENEIDKTIDELRQVFESPSTRDIIEHKLKNLRTRLLKIASNL